jgi:hypothetical protein
MTPEVTETPVKYSAPAAYRMAGYGPSHCELGWWQSERKQPVGPQRRS